MNIHSLFGRITAKNSYLCAHSGRSTCVDVKQSMRCCHQYTIDRFYVNLTKQVIFQALFCVILYRSIRPRKKLVTRLLMMYGPTDIQLMVGSTTLLLKKWNIKIFILFIRFSHLSKLGIESFSELSFDALLIKIDGH